MYSFSDDEEEQRSDLRGDDRGEGSSSSARMRLHATPPPRPAPPANKAQSSTMTHRKSRFDQQNQPQGMIPLDDEEDEGDDTRGLRGTTSPARSTSSSLFPMTRADPTRSNRGGTIARPTSPTLSTFTDQIDGDRHPFTQAPAIDRLQRLWVSERTCPEILAWSSADGLGGERWRCDEVVDEVCAQIEEQVSILNLLSSDEGTSEEEHLRLSMVQLDVERSKWLLRAFLRTRLHKLETHAMHYSSLQPTQRSSLLSPLEQAYLSKYTSIQSAHFSSSVLDYLPESLRGLTDGSDDPNNDDDDEMARSTTNKSGMISRPNLTLPVFIRCEEDCGEVRNEDGESASLTKGSVHILAYGSVRTLVRQGRVQLL